MSLCEYFKVKKSDKKILKQKSFDNPILDFAKDAVWLKTDRDLSPPSYDAETHKLVETTTIPDLSSIDASNPPVVTVRMTAVEMTADEKKAYAATRLEYDDAQPNCCDLEDLFNALIAKGVLAEADCSDHLTAHMTERKRLRTIATG
tara:strand:+ start:178 stop:618 length:441 start_codon:yes stop_codon:yes gene_type:complete